MPLIDPKDLPTLGRMFEHDVLELLKKHTITSAAALICIPREVLREFEGFRPEVVKLITETLRRYGLRQRSISDKLVDFAEDIFGNIENAPIAILNLATTYQDGICRPSYQPLEIIQLLTAVDSTFTIGELLEAKPSVLLSIARDKVPFGPRLRVMEAELCTVNQRLMRWDSMFRIGGLSAQGRHPQLVTA